jgi:hypothetical protein
MEETSSHRFFNKKKAKPAALLKSRKDRRRGLFCRK